MLKSKKITLNTKTKLVNIALIAILAFVPFAKKTFAAVDAELFFSPASQTVASGSDFTVVLTIDPGTNAANTVEAYMTFDETVLRLDDIALSGAFPVDFPESINNTNGTASVAGSVDWSDPGVTTETAVATLTFHALNAALNTAITIESNSIVAADGEVDSVLLTRTPAAVTITGADTIVPTVTAFTIPASFNNLTVPISTFTATDAVGVTGYMVTESPTAPIAGNPNWTGSAPADYTFSDSTGTKTLYAWAKDADGNVSTSLNDSVDIDTTAPTITSVSSDKAAGTYKVGEVIDVDVTFSEAVTSTGNVTVTLETGTTDRTCTFTASNSATGTCNYTVQATDTSSDLEVISIAGTIADQATNAMTNFAPATNLAANEALVIDTTAPTGGSFTIDGGATEATSASVTLDVTCPTDTWGTVQMAFGNSAAPTNWTNCSATTAHTLSGGNGTKTVYMRFRDGGQNTTSDVTDTITLNVPDTTAPEILSSEPSGTLNFGTTSVDLEVVTDEDADCKYSTDAGTTFDSMTDFDTTGSTTHTSPISGLTNGTDYHYYVKCEDGNSNQNSSDYDIIFSVDSEPVVEEEPDPEDTEIHIPKPKVEVSDKKRSLTSYFKKDKKIKFSGRVEELADGKVKLKVDGHTEDADTLNDDGDWSVDVKLDETENVKLYFYDAAGNEVGSKKYKIKIDDEDPVLEGIPAVLSKRVGDKLWWKASDNKGVDYYKYTINGRIRKTDQDHFFIPAFVPRGPHGVTISAYDKAGNKTTKHVLVWVW